MSRDSLMYKMLKEELTALGYWKNRARRRPGQNSAFTAANVQLCGEPSRDGDGYESDIRVPDALRHIHYRKQRRGIARLGRLGGGIRPRGLSGCLRTTVTTVGLIGGNYAGWDGKTLEATWAEFRAENERISDLLKAGKPIAKVAAPN